MAGTSLKDRMAALDEETRAEEMALWGGVAQGVGGRGHVDLVTSPKFREIVSLLHEQPLLVAPALEWLRQKRAAMSMAQLEVLYTPEQIEEMSQQVKP